MAPLGLRNKRGFIDNQDVKGCVRHILFLRVLLGVVVGIQPGRESDISLENAGGELVYP